VHELLRLDDSAEFQIVPTIYNQILILYSIDLPRWLCLDVIAFFNRVEILEIGYFFYDHPVHNNLVGGFSRFQRCVEPAERASANDIEYVSLIRV
jgi:hypothetical protein